MTGEENRGKIKEGGGKEGKIRQGGEGEGVEQEEKDNLQMEDQVFDLCR